MVKKPVRFCTGHKGLKAHSPAPGDLVSVVGFHHWLSVTVPGGATGPTSSLSFSAIDFPLSAIVTDNHPLLRMTQGCPEIHLQGASEHSPLANQSSLKSQAHLLDRSHHRCATNEDFWHGFSPLHNQPLVCAINQGQNSDSDMVADHF